MSGGGIEAVLREHREDAAYPNSCLCDTRIPDRLDDDRYVAHIAAQVLAWLDARLAEGDVVEAVAEELLNVGHQPPSHAEVAFMDVNHAALSAVATVRGVLGGEGS